MVKHIKESATVGVFTVQCVLVGWWQDVYTYCRRRMETEAKEKVFASFWGQNLFQLLTALDEFILFFQIDRGKTASAARN